MFLNSETGYSLFHWKDQDYWGGGGEDGAIANNDLVNFLEWIE